MISTRRRSVAKYRMMANSRMIRLVVPRSRWPTSRASAARKARPDGASVRLQRELLRQPVSQVGGQEDDDQQLERLGWLQVDAAQPDPQGRAAAARVDAEDEGQRGQQQSAGQPQVLVAPQDGQRVLQVEKPGSAAALPAPARASGANRNRWTGGR